MHHTPNILIIVSTEPKPIADLMTLKLIALQNQLQLHKAKHFKKAMRILKLSCVDN